MTTPTTAIAEDLAPTGVLRASINLGNPVLAQGTPAAPSGVTVDIAREVGARLGVPVELVCFDAARKSFEAMAAGRADLCFLAVDPAREAEVAFTAPYVVIEGVYVGARRLAVVSVADVDRDGVRIGVKHGSAYDLFLTRTLAHASVVRGDEGVDVFPAEGLEVGGRHPAADRRLRRGASRRPARRASGSCRSSRPSARRRTRRPRPSVPPRARRGAEGERLRRRRPARSGQSDATVAPPA